MVNLLNRKWQTVKPENVRIFSSDDNILLVQSGWAWEPGDKIIINDIEATVLSVVHRVNKQFSWALWVSESSIQEIKDKLVKDNG